MEKDTNAHQPSATSGRESLPEHVLRTRREFVDLVAKIVADAIPSHRYDVVGIAERLGLSEQTFRRRCISAPDIRRNSLSRAYRCARQSGCCRNIPTQR